MSVHQRLTLEPWRHVLGLTHQELRQQERLRRQPSGCLVLREEVEHLVSKHRNTCGFQADHRSSRIDLRAEHFEDLFELPSRLIEHAEVV